MKTPLPRAYWPTVDWQTALPQDTGMDSAHLERMHDYINAHIPGLHGLLIVHHGYLVFEEYYQGFHQHSYNSISSATKSLTSMLIGVALNQGLLTSLDQPMLDFFPTHAAREKDTRKHAITLRHLLSLQTGFSHEMPHEYWKNPVQLALERPMETEPGKAFFYDSPSVDILSGILTQVTGKSAAAWASETLFKELGIWRDPGSRFTWKQDPDGFHLWHEDAFWDEQNGYLWKVQPQGYSTGSFGAHFTAREMAKLGYLYLNKGVWNGQHIVSEAYVAESTHQHSAGGWPIFWPYGYLWWLTHHENTQAFMASGFGSKLIYVIPELDLVVATIASTKKARTHPQQEEEIRQLVPRFILPAVLVQ